MHHAIKKDFSKVAPSTISSFIHDVDVVAVFVSRTEQPCPKMKVMPVLASKGKEGLTNAITNFGGMAPYHVGGPEGYIRTYIH